MNMKNWIKENEILNIALPSILSNITVPLLSLVDLTIVGHLGASAYIAAIAVGGMVFNMLYWVFAFLRMGTTGITAQFYGARQFEKMGKTLGLSIILSLFNAAIWIIVSYTVGRELLLFYLNDLTVVEYSLSYLKLVVFAEIPLALNNSLNIMYRSQHNTKISFIMSLLGAIYNVFFNALFIYVLKIRNCI